MQHPELIPLEGSDASRLPEPWRRPRAARQTSHYGNRSCVKGPLRAVRIVLMITVIPSLFIFIPMYLRYRVFSGQMYPLGMTDMRLIDNKISTTWCQRQVVRSNATFNAFLLSEQPQISAELVPVSMTRYLTLEDDMKEYWGFYLLKGSVVTVSTCVRWPGASLTMIKGHKHLQDCAYIGDDSSEELEELLEANELGLLSNYTLIERLRTLLKEDSPANDPDTMKRSKTGVRFHDPSQQAQESNTMIKHDQPTMVDSPDVTDHDPQELQKILERLHSMRRSGGAHEKEEDKPSVDYRPPAHLMSLPALHRHRDANVDREERQWLSFNDLDGGTEFQDNDDNNYESRLVNKPDNKTLVNDDANVNNNALNADENKKEHQDTNILNIEERTKKAVKALIEEVEINVTVQDSIEDALKNKEQNLKQSEVDAFNNVKLDTVGEEKIVDTDNKPDEESTEDLNKLGGDDRLPSSAEVYEEIVNQLESMGEKGKRVLQRLTEKLERIQKLQTTKSEATSQENITISKMPEKLDINEEEAEIKLEELRQILLEAMDEERRKDELKAKRHKAKEQARAKRELLIKHAEFQKSLNDDDEARNSALEEGLDPDGYAEDHQIVNETTANDMSNSEFWSSFSSSEEALLECEGLILNLPLTPHPACIKDTTDEMQSHAAEHNAVTYRVPANGYYFFVFNSENEVQENFIRVKFDLQKTMYDLTQKTLIECRNYTNKCELPLKIFSGEKVVLEVPLRDNDSLWNEEFVVISECEPRTSVYLVCVIAVPLLVIIFAFQ